MSYPIAKIANANLIERFTKQVYVAAEVDGVLLLLEEQLVSAQQKVADYRSINTEINKELSELTKKHIELETNYNGIKHELEKMCNDKKSLETVNQNLIKDNTKLKTELAKLKEKLAELESKTETLEDKPVCDVNGKITFTDETLEEMLQQLQNGSTYNQLVEKYGVSRTTIYRRLKEKYPNLKALIV